MQISKPFAVEAAAAAAATATAAIHRRYRCPPSRRHPSQGSSAVLAREPAQEETREDEGGEGTVALPAADEDDEGIEVSVEPWSWRWSWGWSWLVLCDCREGGGLGAPPHATTRGAVQRVGEGGEARRLGLRIT